MNGQMQPSAFLDQVAKDEVLKHPVFPFGWDATDYIALVQVLSLRARRVAKRGRAEIRDFELHGNTAALGIVLQDLADELQVLGKRWWKLADIFLLHPAMQHLFLQRNEHAFVGIASGLALIIEWPHERVREEYPREPLRVEIVGHHGAVGDGTLSVDLVENRVEVGGALHLFLQLILLVEQPLRVLRRQVVVWISE